MELFPITLPKSNICTETELYYRASQPVQYEEQTGQLTLKRKTVLTLDTYFNCFSYQKYLQYTSAQVLEVHLQLQGQFQLRLLKAQLKGKKRAAYCAADPAGAAEAVGGYGAIVRF